MKKRYFYILVLFAVIPVLGWVVFNAATNTETKYVISNESGDRSELGDVNFESREFIGAYGVNIVSVGKRGLEISKAKYVRDYGDYKNVIQNKDLLRGKTIRDDFIDENNKYTVYACVEQDVSGAYIDLNIKNKESSKIIRIKHYAKELYSTVQVRIVDNFIEVLSYASGGNNSIKSYKFDLDSGKLIKEKLIISNMLVEKIVRGEQEKIYIICNDLEERVNCIVTYDAIQDKLTKAKIPLIMYPYSAAASNGEIYFCTQDCDMVWSFNEQGEILVKSKIDIKEGRKDQRSMKVDNDKVYFTDDLIDNISRQKISVYSLKNGNCLYSGYINIDKCNEDISEFITQ